MRGLFHENDPGGATAQKILREEQAERLLMFSTP
jgi:hypothetical protein